MHKDMYEMLHLLKQQISAGSFKILKIITIKTFDSYNQQFHE